MGVRVLRLGGTASGGRDSVQWGPAARKDCQLPAASRRGSGPGRGRAVWVWTVALAAALGVYGAEPLRTAADRPVDVVHLRLDLAVDLVAKSVSGAATIDFVPLRQVEAIRLDAVGLVVSEVTAGDGKKLTFDNTGTELVIDTGRMPAGTKERLVIRYRVHDPKDGLHFFAPSPAEPETPYTVWSQGEPISNRYWFPCFDHPNEQQTTELVVTVEDGYEVLSNGRLVSKRSADGRTVFHWRQTEPHVAYLVTLAVGKFTVVAEKWRETPVLYYVPPARAADVPHSFSRTPEMLEFFSRKFGVDYPWAKYAQVVVEQFNAGGMENTSATTLHESVLHDERALLDHSPDWLVAHELGHQWWGDLLTCKDWAHLWLNEGFATYCEVLWAEHKLGRDEADFQLYHKSKAARSGTATSRPIVDRFYPHPNSMFDNRAYPKGGWVLHMLRKQLGDADFFGCLKKYAERYRHQTVETGDLRRVFERCTGRSLERFFYDWTERPGHPVLEIDTGYDENDKLLRVSVKQTQPQDAFTFPLRIDALCTGRADPVIVNKEIREKELVFYIPAPSRPQWVRVDPEHTLLAEIRENKSREWWLRQLTAPSVPERLRAVEHFSTSQADEDRKLLIGVLKSDGFYGVKAEAASALGKMGGDRARDALIEGLSAADARVRTAAAGALGKFAGDEKVVAALKAKSADPDRSYGASAAVVEALAKVQPVAEIGPLLAALEKESRHEVIRQAALRGLGHSNDPKALDVLLAWTGRNKPRECRTTALRVLPVALVRIALSEDRIRQVVAGIEGYLRNEGPHVRRASAESLRDLGRLARPAERSLEAMAGQDPNPALRDLARSALERIRAETPPAVELARLREQLDRLKKTDQTLEQRLQKMESK